MTVTVQDTIERQLVIPVGRQRVWDAITAPEQIAKWFSDAITMELMPGSPIVFHWDGYGDRRGRVETIDPPNRFAYRWIPTGRDGSRRFPSTRFQARWSSIPLRRLRREPG